MPDTTPLTPMTPPAAISAFSYLRAVQADDTGAAREFAGAEPRMPELLVDVAERIVVPVTALPGPEAGEPCADTFALEALGRAFVCGSGRRPGRTRPRASPAPSSTSRSSSSPRTTRRTAAARVRRVMC
ncbi:hypothetical protein [Streptomyces canarius]|uniref:Uncharacterized protein n=1 Tax=Streptomyces canarius TaxID=285453 RepID=A0ABQ3DCB4_9ACTN|nr:hypothetical protein [Streptomyces canarius]GHA73164.1 hypothetical protein GCM10010345_89990 [Streptomyces canarius]